MSRFYRFREDELTNLAHLRGVIREENIVTIFGEGWLEKIVYDSADIARQVMDEVRNKGGKYE